MTETIDQALLDFESFEEQRPQNISRVFFYRRYILTPPLRGVKIYPVVTVYFKSHISQIFFYYFFMNFYLFFALFHFYLFFIFYFTFLILSSTSSLWWDQLFQFLTSSLLCSAFRMTILPGDKLSPVSSSSLELLQCCKQLLVAGMQLRIIN